MIVIECIPECIFNHGIYKHSIVHSIAETCIRKCEGRHRHVFHTACNHDVCIASQNHLCCHIDTVQTRTAYDIHCDCRCLDRESCLDGRLTCNILSETRLNNTSHIHMIHLVSRNASPVQRFLDYDRTELLSRSCAE